MNIDNFSKNKSLFLILGTFLCILIIPFLQILNPNLLCKSSINQKKIFYLHTSYYNTSMSPIYINADASGVGAHNWSWAVNQPWCTGSGIKSDPYIIANLTIDGMNSSSCIEIWNSDAYCQIRNCTLYNAGPNWFDAGIYLAHVQNCQIINDTIINNEYQGLIMVNSNSTIVKNNTISNNGDEGIYSTRCCSNTILRNNISGNGGSGIDLSDNSFNNNISDNFIFSNGHIGIRSWKGSLNLISDNIICNNDYVGIYLTQSPSNTISNNNISHNQHNGIYLRWSDNSTINSNKMQNNSQMGIEIYKSDHSIIETNNICSNKFDGILIQESPESTISNNKITNNSAVGINIAYCNDLTITRNYIENNSYGVFLFFSNHSIISLNLVTQNKNDGIHLYKHLSIGENRKNSILNNWIWNNSKPLGGCLENNNLGINYYCAPDEYDSDSDGLSDIEEINLGTDPGNADTDGDYLPDGFEIKYGTNPLDDDSDDDGHLDGIEVASGTDPLNSDDYPGKPDPSPQAIPGFNIVMILSILGIVAIYLVKKSIILSE